MKQYIVIAATALAAVVMASSVSAGIYPESGGGCGCIYPCFPY